jgi:hypothetical protein
MKSSQKHAFSASVVAFVFLLSACTSVHSPSGYLGDYSKLQEGAVLKQEYIAPDADLYSYTKAQVKPVEMKYFENAGGEFSQADIEELSSDLHSSLEAQLGKKYQVIAETAPADSKTLVVRPALVYVKTPDRLLNALTWWFLFGLTFSKGAAAFEAKLADGGSGREIAQVAEKRKSAGGITDVKGIFLGGWLRFASAEGIFKRWGKDLVKLTSPPEK